MSVAGHASYTDRVEDQARVSGGVSVPALSDWSSVRMAFQQSSAEAPLARAWAAETLS